MKQNHSILYYNLMTTRALNEHIADVKCKAESMFQSLVKSFAEQEDVTEKMKFSTPMEWVQKMNNVRIRAIEIVNTEVIFV